MNSTAIAASIMPITLDITSVQCTPSILYNLAEFANISHVASKVKNAAITVTRVPFCLTRIIVVKITPGPVSNGVPTGMLKSCPCYLTNLSDAPKTYNIPITKGIMPPAIWKLFKSMPKKSNI